MVIKVPGWACDIVIVTFNLFVTFVVLQFHL